MPADEYGPPVVHEEYGPPPVLYEEYGPPVIHEEYGPPVVHEEYGPPPVPHDEYGPPADTLVVPHEEYGVPADVPVGPYPPADEYVPPPITETKSEVVAIRTQSRPASFKEHIPIIKPGVVVPFKLPGFLPIPIIKNPLKKLAAGLIIKKLAIKALPLILLKAHIAKKIALKAAIKSIPLKIISAIKKTPVIPIPYIKPEIDVVPVVVPVPKVTVEKGIVPVPNVLSPVFWKKAIATLGK